MYAIIATGGKQYRVEPGQRLQVERLPGAEQDGEVRLRPVLLVDGESVVSAPDALAGVTVSAKVLGEAKGAKIRGFTYKSKANQRRRWGHRQVATTIEITGISR